MSSLACPGPHLPGRALGGFQGAALKVWGCLVSGAPTRPSPRGPLGGAFGQGWKGGWRGVIFSAGPAGLVRLAPTVFVCGELKSAAGLGRRRTCMATPAPPCAALARAMWGCPLFPAASLACPGPQFQGAALQVLLCM